MKHQPLLLVISFFFIIVSCQNTDPNTRPSPLLKDSIVVEGVVYKTEYSSPAVKKRKIWGDLEPYNQVWRTGANDATIVEIGSSIIIAGKELPKGKYALFTIPRTDEWTIIFNKEWKQWGAYNYNSDLDQLRIDIKPNWVSTNQERLRIFFDESTFNLRWEYVDISLEYKIIK